MVEHHCLQLAEESYLPVFPVKFRDITAFDWGGEWLLVRVNGRFEKWWFHSLICSLCPVRLLWWKGGRKVHVNHATTVVCKETNLIMQGATRFASPRNVFPRLGSISIHLWIRHCCTFCAAIYYSFCFLALAKQIFCTQFTELPFFLQFKRTNDEFVFLGGFYR